MHRRVAVLIDGGYFRKRFPVTFGPLPVNPEELASKVYGMALAHARGFENLYRIFYYDCPPIDKKAQNPVTKRPIDFSKTSRAIYMNKFIEELKKKRKIALRLGHLSDFGEWLIRPRLTKDIINGKIDPTKLNENDVSYEMKQKGVDMKIGVDIATLALKKLVGKIILVAGDADFVPASKLARREGIDFVLDPMWNHIHPDLNEHIDGLDSKCPKPKLPKSLASTTQGTTAASVPPGTGSGVPTTPPGP
jgi:uncharacterized LabA/DUF88 family protein